MMQRRDFLRGAAAAGCLVAGGRLAGGLADKKPKLESRNERRSMEYARLGRTNLKVSRITHGSLHTNMQRLPLLAKLYEGAFRMPFPAVPIFFYNELDGRGPISIRDGFDDHFEVIRWWAEIDKPVEINDPHQWQLRNSTDDLLVADHVIAGVVALKMGIRHYIMQMMYDLPPGTSGLNDLAKFMGAYELLEPLTRHFDYQIIKETRGGLSDFPPNLDKAKGHLAISTYWQM